MGRYPSLKPETKNGMEQTGRNNLFPSIPSYGVLLLLPFFSIPWTLAPIFSPFHSISVQFQSITFHLIPFHYRFYIMSPNFWSVRSKSTNGLEAKINLFIHTIYFSQHQFKMIVINVIFLVNAASIKHYGHLLSRQTLWPVPLLPSNVLKSLKQNSGRNKFWSKILSVH